jgi:hypothetical protein
METTRAGLLRGQSLKVRMMSPGTGSSSASANASPPSQIGLNGLDFIRPVQYLIEMQARLRHRRNGSLASLSSTAAGIL